MKFKAHIKLTDEQKTLRRMADKTEVEAIDIEFSIQDLIEELTLDQYTPDIRQILVPWLMDKNQPEVIYERHFKDCTFIGLLNKD